MDLWIRSQDKRHLINCEALMLEQVGNGKWGIRAFSKNYDYNICNYKTKERALEVLNEIQNILKPKISYTPIITEEQKAEYRYKHFVTEQAKVEIVELSTYVYEMPEE